MLQDLSFHVVGVSHHTATVGVREQFAFTPAELDDLLTRERAAGRSALLLSTCNRLRAVLVGVARLRVVVPGPRPRAWRDPLGGALVRKDDVAAVRHLFTVAAGLDSQILGETEILGQVRRAYDAARAAGTTTREMDAIFSAALSTGRRVRRETLLGRHPASVSSAAVELAAREWTDGIGGPGGGRARSGRGGGGRAPCAARQRRRSAWRWSIGIRSALASLADSLGRVGRTAGRRSPSACRARISCSSRQPPRGRSCRPPSSPRRSRGGRRRWSRSTCRCPRNVEPEARALPGVRLFDLDDLQRLCCPAAAAPAAALHEPSACSTRRSCGLEQQLRGRAAAPRLAELHRLGAEVAEQEAAWALAQLADLSEREQLVVREMAERLVRRVLYPVSRSLRDE